MSLILSFVTTHVTFAFELVSKTVHIIDKYRLAGINIVCSSSDSVYQIFSAIGLLATFSTSKDSIPT